VSHSWRNAVIVAEATKIHKQVQYRQKFYSRRPTTNFKHLSLKDYTIGNTLSLFNSCIMDTSYTLELYINYHTDIFFLQEQILHGRTLRTLDETF
jgi:hypothetical protein